MKKLVILGCALILTNCLMAVNLSYKISSMGLKVADLSISLDSNNISIHAESSTKSLIFPHLNNHYQITFDDSAQPLTYLRIIHQDSLRDSVFVKYTENDTVRIWQKSKDQELVYPVARGARDVFSLLFYLVKTDNASGEFLLDGNGVPWKAVVRDHGNETIRTTLGRFIARKYVINFEALSTLKTPYIDMLTHNILSADTTLSVYVSPDGIPIKAMIKKNKLGMTWDLLSISE